MFKQWFRNLGLCCLPVCLLACAGVSNEQHNLEPEAGWPETVTPPVYRVLDKAQRQIESNHHEAADRLLRGLLERPSQLNGYELATVWQLYAAMALEKGNDAGVIYAYEQLLKYRGSVPETVEMQVLNVLAQYHARQGTMEEAMAYLADCRELGLVLRFAGGCSLTSGDSILVPIKYVSPRYPRRAMERGLEGHVVLNFTVGIDGSPVMNSVKIIESHPAGVFDKSVLKALRAFKYRPALMKGEPMPTENVEYRFGFGLGGR